MEKGARGAAAAIERKREGKIERCIKEAHPSTSPVKHFVKIARTVRIQNPPAYSHP
jgi:hypothetical protein